MKAFVLAAGLGTRLRPWTLEHPKALVPVGGVPMLERIIVRLRNQGFDDITVNVHHFAEQIIDFLKARDFGVTIHINDESGQLLDTGGAIVGASRFLAADDRPFLVHNVDILSDAPLAEIMEKHIARKNGISLMTSDRESSRKLVFNESGELMGWHNLKTEEYRPAGFQMSERMHERAFSGIYVVEPRIINDLREYSDMVGSKAFPIMDFLLEDSAECKIDEIAPGQLHLIDIGKPETLSLAESVLGEGSSG